MQEMTLIGRAEVRAEILPARAAYLVEADNCDAALTAVREASTRWAGVTEPIVPVSPEGLVADRWTQVVEFANVDGLVSIDVPTGHAESAATQLGLPIVEIAEIDRSGTTRHSIHPGFVGAQPPEELDPSWAMAGDQGALWQSFAVGDYHPDYQDDLEVLPVTFLEATDVLEACNAQIQDSTWLDFGVRHFREYPVIHNREGWNSFGPAPVIVWLTKPDDLADCIQFWNVRALRSLRLARVPMALSPVAPEIDWEQIAEQLRTRLRRPDEFEPDVVLYSRNVDKETQSEIASRLGLVPSSVQPYSRWASPRPPLRQTPYTYRIDMDPRQFVNYKRRYGANARTSVQVYRQGTEVEFESPVKFNGPGDLLIRLQSDLLDGLPKHPAVAAMIHEDADWHGDRLQICASASDSYRLNLHVPSLNETAWALLRDRCEQAELSPSGRTARRLLELDGHEVLLDGNVRASIEALRTRRPKRPRG